MLYYIKSYPISILVILVVVYLSFINPPSQALPKFPGWDKLAHLGMYGLMSGMLWMEYLVNHRKEKLRVLPAIIGAVICPIVFSGLVEIGQRYFTWHRSGDWMDFLANSIGVLIASLISWFILRPLIVRQAPD